MTLLELHYQRGRTKNAAVTLLDAAVTESQNLTVSEQVRY